jgi:hypothetical protein
MSSKSPVERIVNAFVTYAKATLPGLVTTANVGQTLAAPALKKIEKAGRVDIQYFPCAAINLDSVEFSDSGAGSMRADLVIDVFVCASDSKPANLAAYLDRYLDAVVDLASNDATVGAEGFELKIDRADKGLEPEGTRGWVAVSFTVWGEAPF